MPRAAQSRRGWLLLLGAALGLHAGLSLAFPDAIWTTPCGIGGSVLVGLALCLRAAWRADAEMRWRWLTLAALLMVWIAALLALIHAQWVGADDQHPLFYNLLFALRGVPILLLVARAGDTDDSKAFFRVDTAQALLFAALAVIMLFPSLIGGPGQPLLREELQGLYHNTQNFGLALLSGAAVIGQPRGERRLFAAAVFGMLATYAMSAAFVNHVLIAAGPPPGSIFNMLADLPMVALILIAARPPGQAPACGERQAEWLHRLLLPMGFCLASLAASLAVAEPFPSLGFAGAVAAIALYALRSAIVQVQLKRAQQLITEVVERLPDALCVVGPDGRVTLGNNKASALFGQATHGAAFEALMAGLPTPDRPGEIITPDGRTWTVAEARLSEGSMIVGLSDISAIRATERDREEALQFLSHDMRSPSVAIITLLEERELAHAVRGDAIDRIRRYARHGLGLADDFVRLARLRAARPERAPVDLNDVAAEAADLVWPLARDRQVTLAADPGGETWVMGDRAVLIRAVHNLLDNGVKFAPRGATLRYGVRAEGETARLHVTSPGPDLPPGRAGNLFEPFGAGTPSGRLDSVGLGLAFVHTATQQHGGTVTHRSEGGMHIFTIDIALTEIDSS